MPILDGALATELEARGCDLNDPLWSGKVVLEQPELVREVHLAYLEAGADVISSGSYQLSVARLTERGLSREEAENVMRGSVTLAADACATHSATRRAIGRPLPRVAVSIGSYGAYLADGSEYTGEYEVSRAALHDFHAPTVRMLAAVPQADLVLFETVPRLDEALAVVDLADTIDRPIWLSFACRDRETIADGTPLRRAAAEVAARPGVRVLGVNCCDPRDVTHQVEVLRAASDRPVLVYPNAGEHYGGQGWTGERLGPEAYAQLARAWADAGAQVIGGCCRTTPAHVAAVRHRLGERF